ncbi:hypothetical protein Tco_0190479 [Tanacetum coccineum]
MRKELWCARVRVSGGGGVGTVGGGGGCGAGSGVEKEVELQHLKVILRDLQEMQSAQTAYDCLLDNVSNGKRWKSCMKYRKQQTVNSVHLLPIVYNDIGKLDLE